jgi:putative toxin-antitoxin system antitoxin component (TIGR02293 family)
VRRVRSSAQPKRQRTTPADEGSGAVSKRRQRPVQAEGETFESLGLPVGVTGLKAHDLVIKGLSTAAATRLMHRLRVIPPSAFYRVIGISERTFQRRAASRSKALDANTSDRALRLASITALATKVLGDQERAEHWLSSPAIGLDQRRPIDLLQTSEGTELVRSLLTRMDYGVYS